MSFYNCISLIQWTVCSQWFFKLSGNENYLFKIQTPGLCSRSLNFSTLPRVLCFSMFLIQDSFWNGACLSHFENCVWETLPTTFIFFMKKYSVLFWFHLTNVIVIILKYLIFFFKLSIPTIFSPIKYWCFIPKNLYNLRLFLLWVYWNLGEVGWRDTWIKWYPWCQLA